MRDPTRGGLSSSLNEIAANPAWASTIEEAAIPVREEVRGACEMLGLDPLYVANEGKLMAIVAPAAADELVAAMRQHPAGPGSAKHRHRDRSKSRLGHDADAARNHTHRGHALGRSIA